MTATISPLGIPIRVAAGLATFGPVAVALRAALDEILVDWATADGAAAMLCPPLAIAADLARYDYFDNFPHLALAAAPLIAQPNELPGPTSEDATVRPEQLGPTDLLLPSAACYGVYTALAGAQLTDSLTITTVAQCFRRETRYEGLRRLHGFTMREIIRIGRPDEVRAHLSSYKLRIEALLRQLDIGVSVQVATDPFFEPNGSRAAMQRMFPVKEEFVTADGVAIASVNYHRNFFGERAPIGIGGEAAYTGCVAFGLERWLHALQTRYDHDWDAALRAVQDAKGREVS